MGLEISQQKHRKVCGWCESIGYETYFHQSGCEIALIFQQLSEHVDILKE